MQVYLFGYLSYDYYGRVVVTPDSRTVGDLAAQLTAWGPAPERAGPTTVRNEAYEVLDPASTIAEAGLRSGHIVRVEVTE